MDERTLLKVALICALVGILILIIISDRITYSKSNISSITLNQTGSDVLIKGQVSSIQETPNLFIFTLQDDTGKIKVVAFKEKIKLQEGQIVEVLGTTKEYNSKPEIEAKRIRIF